MQCCRELRAHFGVAGAAESNEVDSKVQPGSKTLRAYAGQERHGSASSRRSQWKQELSAGLDGREPGRRRMCCACAGNNYVGGFKRSVRAVALDDGNLRPGSKRGPRPFREVRVDLYSRDLALRAGYFGKDRGVVACAAPEMQHMIIGSDAKLVERLSPKTGLAVVDALCLIKHDERVVIDAPRIGGNWGIVSGELTDVIDVDTKPTVDGMVSLRALEAE